MKFRKLRIAWSAAWGVVCLLLVILWVRSYSWGEQAQYTTLLKTYYGIRSDYGYLTGFQGDFRPSRHTPGWLRGSGVPSRQWQSFTFNWNSERRIIALPHWAVAIMFAAAASAPWLRFRFSLRTLLIATMLVAVLLGIVVMMLRGS